MKREGRWEKKNQPRAMPTPRKQFQQICVVERDESAAIALLLSTRAQREMYICTISKFTTLNMESFPTLQTTISDRIAAQLLQPTARLRSQPGRDLLMDLLTNQVQDIRAHE